MEKKEKRVTLINKDTFKALKSIPDNSIDLVLCDLPYGATQNAWDSVLPLPELFAEYKRICKDDAAIVLFGSMPFTAELVMAGRDMFKYSMVWKKNKSTGHLNAKKRPMRQHEDVLVFCKKTPKYFPQKTTGHKPMNFAVNESGSGDGAFSTNYGRVKPTTSNAGSTERYPTSILDFKVVNNDDPARSHPTQKPVELLENIILTYSEENGTVLDNTMGTGSTGVAAVLQNRKFIGIELDKIYFDQAKDWINSFIK